MAVKTVVVMKTQKHSNITWFCPHKGNTYVKLRVFLQYKLKYLTSFTGLQHLHITAAVRQIISTNVSHVSHKWSHSNMRRTATIKICQLPNIRFVQNWSKARRQDDRRAGKATLTISRLLRNSPKKKKKRTCSDNWQWDFLIRIRGVKSAFNSHINSLMLILLHKRVPLH
jgi:hypothetical protein